MIDNLRERNQQLIEEFRHPDDSRLALIGALRDPYPPSRREAVRALKAIGHPRAIPALSEVMETDPSAEVREEAAEAVESLRHRGSGSAG